MKIRFARSAAKSLAELFRAAEYNDDALRTAAASRLRAFAHALCRLPYVGHIGLAPGTLQLRVPELPLVIVYGVEIGDTDQVVILGIYHVHQQRG
jgi:hypothetical protein